MRVLAAGALLAAILGAAAGCSRDSGDGARPAAVAAGQSAADPAERQLLDARIAYTSTIVPVYPLAVDLANRVLTRPAGSAAPASDLGARLRGVDARLGAKVAATSFPASAAATVAALRADSRRVLADLDRLGSVGVAGRRQAATDLFTLARRIGVLGVDLGLAPAEAS